MLTDLLQNVLQSYDEFTVSSRLEITMTIVHVPSGGALVKLNKLNKKCLPRSLILGKALACNSQLLNRRTDLLIIDIGCILNDVVCFSKILKKYEIITLYTIVSHKMIAFYTKRKKKTEKNCVILHGSRKTIHNY